MSYRLPNRYADIQYRHQIHELTFKFTIYSNIYLTFFTNIFLHNNSQFIRPDSRNFNVFLLYWTVFDCRPLGIGCIYLLHSKEYVIGQYFSVLEY